MGCCDAPDLMPLDEAVSRIRQSIEPIRATETLPLVEALDRVLAAEVCAPIAVPGYDNSAMDGYALRHGDLQRGEPLQLIGKALAGQAFDGVVRRGQCVRIMTGAPLPAGADTVVMQEDTRREGQQLLLLQPHQVRAGDHVRRAGSDIAAGTQVLVAGKRLGPLDIGLLASLGIAEVAVRRRPRVALLSTGDELQRPGQALAAGQIYDSNRPLIAAILARLNVELVDLGIVADEPGALRRCFTEAAERCDLVISSGGVSVGDADHTRAVLAELGAIDFWKIAIKPGKPLAFGRLGHAWFFGLPGNPVSAALTFHQLALPALQQLAGEKPAPALALRASASQPLRKRPGRTDFQRGCFSQGTDGLEVETSGAQSSALLSGFGRANCYIKLGQFACDTQAGEPVEIIPFDRWIS